MNELHFAMHDDSNKNSFCIGMIRTPVNIGPDKSDGFINADKGDQIASWCSIFESPNNQYHSIPISTDEDFEYINNKDYHYLIYVYNKGLPGTSYLNFYNAQISYSYE